MNRRNRALLRALAPLALMGLIFYFSAQPAGGHHAWWVIISRKLGHITGYALLTALWAWALQGVVRRPVLIAVSIALPTPARTSSTRPSCTAGRARRGTWSSTRSEWRSRLC